MLEWGTVTRDKGQGTEDERGEKEKRWKCGERESRKSGNSNSNDGKERIENME